LYIPPFLRRFLSNISIQALHGLTRDTDTLETILKSAGVFAKERRDFNLMALDSYVPVPSLRFPKGLTMRPARFSDMDELTVLQEYYQKEEVLRRASDYNRVICRLGLRKMINEGKTLVALVDGVIAGKINTSAFAFNRYQLGGVYVHPVYRGRGIAGAMTAVFSRALLAEGKGVSLFVKKSNTIAEHIYRRCGFSKLADYRIVYMN
jgi:predicted GNAT family acetyltransferase